MLITDTNLECQGPPIKGLGAMEVNDQSLVAILKDKVILEKIITIIILIIIVLLIIMTITIIKI